MILELAILTFPHPDGAERAYAHLGPLPDDTPWALSWPLTRLGAT